MKAITDSQQQQQQRPPQQQPSPPATDGPWTTDKRWASGRISDGATTSMIFMWVFAIFWNAIATIATVAGYEQMRAGGRRGFSF